MKTLVLGASGQIGAYTVQDLAEFSKADVIASSRRLGNVKKAVTHLNLVKKKIRVEEHSTETKKFY